MHSHIIVQRPRRFARLLFEVILWWLDNILQLKNRPFLMFCFFAPGILCSLLFSFLQILAGIYPVSQLQEPYSSVGYLCERVSFLSVLKLKHPSLLENNPQQGNQGSAEISWTAWDVCEGKSLLCETAVSLQSLRTNMSGCLLLDVKYQSVWCWHIRSKCHFEPMWCL